MKASVRGDCCGLSVATEIGEWARDGGDAASDVCRGGAPCGHKNAQGDEVRHTIEGERFRRRGTADSERRTSLTGRGERSIEATGGFAGVATVDSCGGFAAHSRTPRHVFVACFSRRLARVKILVTGSSGLVGSEAVTPFRRAGA